MRTRARRHRGGGGACPCHQQAGHDHAGRRLLFRSGGAVRDQTLDEMAALGADVIKAQVYWNEVSPRVRRKPAGFDSADPASYDLSAYDGLVQAIVARGMRPYLVIGNRAPDWAVRKVTPSPRDGIYKPSSKEFRLFARAAGRHFDGTVGGVPRVNLWAIWNEPNLKSWLAPQRSSKGVPLAPSIYREPLPRGAQGPRRDGARLRHDPARRADAAGGRVPTKFTPLDFLREMVCLDRHYRQYRGAAAKARKCRKVGRIATSGIALHPYTSRAGLRSRPKPGETPINAALAAHAPARPARAGAASCPGGCRCGSPSTASRPNPPDPYQRRSRRCPRRWTRASGSPSAIAACAPTRSTRSRTRASTRAAASALRPLPDGAALLDGRVKRACTTRSACRCSSVCLAPAVWRFSAGLRTGAGAVARIESRRRGGSYRPLAQARLNSAGYFRKVLRVSGAHLRTYRVTIGGRSRVKKPVRP